MAEEFFPEGLPDVGEIIKFGDQLRRGTATRREARQFLHGYGLSYGYPNEVTLGLYQSWGMYEAALEQAGCNLWYFDHEVFLHKEFAFTLIPTQIKIVIRSVADLGFNHAVPYRDLCVRIKDRGFELCPAEVGLALRLAYMDQPVDESLTIAMDALPREDGTAMVVGIYHSSGLGKRIDTFSGSPDFPFDPTRLMVLKLK